jgi:N-acetylglucosaminyldiphosphoundecaprenol N-acetyl-beta-D-mannosaminyltransferase
MPRDSAPLPRVRIAGVPVDAVELDDALHIIDSYIAEQQPHYNIAINASKVVAFHENPAMRRAIESADLLTADGQPIVWASSLFGRRLPGRASGIDLMERLFAHAEHAGHSVFLLGATDAVLQKCIDRLLANHPRLTIAGFRNGYFSSQEEPTIIAHIRCSKPDILFLGFGSPKKEYFMAEHVDRLNVPFVMGVGGAFDVYAGITSRAPTWMRRSGLEWLFRVLQEPKRMFRRYAVGNSKFIWIVGRLAIRNRVETIVQRLSATRK